MLNGRARLPGPHEHALRWPNENVNNKRSISKANCAESGFEKHQIEQIKTLYLLKR